MAPLKHAENARRKLPCGARSKRPFSATFGDRWPSLGLKRSGLCLAVKSWYQSQVGFLRALGPRDRYRRLFYKINSFSLNSPLKGQNVFRATFGQLHDPAGDGFHDFFVFVSILKLVVNIGDAALAMVLDSVHGVAAKT